MCAIASRSSSFLEDHHLLAEGLEAVDEDNDSRADAGPVPELQPPYETDASQESLGGFFKHLEVVKASIMVGPSLGCFRGPEYRHLGR